MKEKEKPAAKDELEKSKTKTREELENEKIKAREEIEKKLIEKTLRPAEPAEPAEIKLAAPAITSPSAGGNIDRKQTPVITLTGIESREWIKNNPMNVMGMITYAKQLSFPEIRGRITDITGKGAEANVSVTVSVDNDEFEYSARSDASGNFTVSGVNISISDEKTELKINNEQVNVAGGSFQYSWLLDQGANKLNIDFSEKPLKIVIKVKAVTNSGSESPMSQASYSSTGKKASLSKEQKLDSMKPVIEINPLISDGRLKITTRDPEPTSGVYQVTAEGVSFKRVEGTEKDGEQVWEGILQIVKPNLPPPPPASPDRPISNPLPEGYNYRKIIQLKVKVTDKAENIEEKTETVTVYFE